MTVTIHIGRTFETASWPALIHIGRTFETASWPALCGLTAERRLGHDGCVPRMNSIEGQFVFAYEPNCLPCLLRWGKR